MGKPALGIRCRYRLPDLSQCSIERLIRARLRTPHRLLDLRPTPFNRRQVGRIRRQAHNLSPTLSNRFGNTRHFVSAQNLPRTPIPGYPSLPRRPAPESAPGLARHRRETHHPSSPRQSSSTPWDHTPCAHGGRAGEGRYPFRVSSPSRSSGPLRRGRSLLPDEIHQPAGADDVHDFLGVGRGLEGVAGARVLDDALLDVEGWCRRAGNRPLLPAEGGRKR